MDEKILAELAVIEKQVNEHPDKQLSMSEPDLGVMKTSNTARQACYNVHSTVDTKHHLIISHEVTQTPGRGELHAAVNKALIEYIKKPMSILAPLVTYCHTCAVLWTKA